VAAVADGLTQHSLPGGRYPLPGPDFHRLNQISFSWRTPSDFTWPVELCARRLLDNAPMESFFASLNRTSYYQLV